MDTENLLQNLGERCLVDLDKLLQLIKIIAEEPKAFVKRDIVRR